MGGDHQTLAVLGDGRDTRGDTDRDRFEPTQFVHHIVDLLSVCSLGVEDQLGIVENYEHLLGGKKGSEGSQIIGILDTCTGEARSYLYYINFMLE